jgi:hypothetical protein
MALHHQPQCRHHQKGALHPNNAADVGFTLVHLVRHPQLHTNTGYIVAVLGQFTVNDPASQQ